MKQPPHLLLQDHSNAWVSQRAGRGEVIGEDCEFLLEPAVPVVVRLDEHATSAWRRWPAPPRLIVAVFAGAKPSSGYDITVQRLLLRGGTLRAVVAQHAPTSGSYTLPAFTRPCEVLEIALTPARGVKHWVLVTSRGRLQRPARDTKGA